MIVFYGIFEKILEFKNTFRINNIDIFKKE